MAHKGRLPTYHTAIRLARLVLELRERRYGWRFDAICRHFKISERTLLRYIKALKSSLDGRDGSPTIEVMERDEHRVLRFAAPHEAPHSNAFEAASLFFTLTILRFLSGTVLEQGVEDLWDRVYEGMTSSQRLRLDDLQRKFYTIEYAPKDYRSFDEDLDIILRAVLAQQRLSIEYRGISGDPRTHQFEPYTLLAYRGGLYLLGRSDLADQILYLAVERIRKVSFSQDLGGQPIHFILPRAYDPARYTEGTFGLVSGDEAEVEILLRSDEAETYLRSRAIHPTQQFHQRADGRTVLSMKVRGTVELRNWVLGFGPWLEVLKPEALRREIAGLFTEAGAIYAASADPAVSAITSTRARQSPV
ncbi:MAG: helix-turn-helix transcriptional regulator [Candidatus Binataceae bacterium]